MCSKKSRKIHWKTPVLEPLFNKANRPLLEDTSAQVFSREFWEIYKNTSGLPKLYRTNTVTLIPFGT